MMRSIQTNSFSQGGKVFLRTYQSKTHIADKNDLRFAFGGVQISFCQIHSLCVNMGLLIHEMFDRQLIQIQSQATFRLFCSGILYLTGMLYIFMTFCRHSWPWTHFKMDCN